MPQHVKRVGRWLLSLRPLVVIVALLASQQPGPIEHRHESDDKQHAVCVRLEMHVVRRNLGEPRPFVPLRYGAGGDSEVWGDPVGFRAEFYSDSEGGLNAITARARVVPVTGPSDVPIGRRQAMGEKPCVYMPHLPFVFYAAHSPRCS
jgi:hypothetical protein